HAQREGVHQQTDGREHQGLCGRNSEMALTDHTVDRRDEQRVSRRTNDFGNEAGEVWIAGEAAGVGQHAAEQRIPVLIGPFSRPVGPLVDDVEGRMRERNQREDRARGRAGHSLHPGSVSEKQEHAPSRPASPAKNNHNYSDGLLVLSSCRYKRSISRSRRSTSYRPSTWVRARAPIAMRAASSRSSPVTAAASASTSPAGISTPSSGPVTRSGTPPTANATPGTPAAMLSMRATGVPSLRDVRATRSLAA